MKPKLSGYTWKKGIFQSVWNEIANPLETEKSWTYGQLPEYIWLALILDKLGRIEGIDQSVRILKYWKAINPKIEDCRFSTLLAESVENQQKLFNQIQLFVGDNTLEPLTLIFDIHEYPTFNGNFYNKMSIEKRLLKIEQIMQECMGSQTNMTTDIKYIVLFFRLIRNKINVKKGQEHIIDDLNDYARLSHENEKMRTIRPLVRSMFGAFQSMDKSNLLYLNKFWEGLSCMSTCKLFSVNLSEVDEQNLNKDQCVEAFQNIFDYFISIKQDVLILDEKMTVLLGLAVFAYNRFYEVYKHDLDNSISGRSSVRGLFEILIIMKYLIHETNNHDNIWMDYQLYGLGKYKLVCEVNKDKINMPEGEGTHIPLKYLNILVEEFFRPEFLDINTNYFDDTNIRKKAEITGLADLYATYYEYLTSYEHGFWGSIRESSFVKCDNPAHQYHCIPSIEQHDNLTSVWNDCVLLMHHIVNVLNEEYGIPDKLLVEVNKFDPKSVNG